MLQGKFPKKFKIAKINPIFKKGNKTDICNHRPIAILCNLSKVFENLIYNRIRQNMEEMGVLSENQFGFRKQKNTELAVLNLINRALPAIQNKLYAVCIFLDFSKCFDTISRETLLAKFRRYGFDIDSLNLIASYFTDRKQFVTYKGTCSDLRDQTLGVVQGSKNGPLFFDIFSNDINVICEPTENLLFADDLCLIYVGDNLENLIELVNNRLTTILDWCRFNKMSINPEKSEYIIITNRKLPFEPQILLGNDLISRKTHVKYLGLTIDERLKFSEHLDYRKIKLS